MFAFNLALVDCAVAYLSDSIAFVANTTTKTLGAKLVANERFDGPRPRR